MNKLLHRYKIWQLGGNSPAEREAPEPPPTQQVEDLIALMALYDYRPLIETELTGTCSLANGGSASCKTTTISADAVNLVCDTHAARSPKRSQEVRKGSAVHLKLDQIGPVHGVIAAQKAEKLRVAVDDECKPMLRSKLSRMAAEHAIDLYEGAARTQSHAMKIEPAIKKCSFIDHTGTVRQGVVVTLSRIDALIKARIIPPMRTRIIFCGSRRHSADVVRNFEMGFAARFCAAIPAEEFSAAIKLSDSD